MATQVKPGGDLRLYTARGSIRDSIERYFEVSLFLLLVTGFFTLASTGRLDMPSVAVVAFALLFRAWLLLRRRVLVIPERMTSLITLLYVLFYAIDLFFISGSFVTASVHLVLFSMVVKIFSVQRDRDHVYLAILAFLAVLSAAVLTVDTIFLVSFCIFLLLAVTTFTSMEMKRSAAASGCPVEAPRGHRMEQALSLSGFVLVVAMMAAGTVIFFILPRVSAGYLSDYAPRSEFVSGFSDHVTLGEIGKIKQSDTVVMHVTIQRDHGNHDLKWRGVALSQFDGKNWFNAAGAWMDLRTSLNGQFNLYPEQVREHNLVAPWERNYGEGIDYHVEMEPIGTNIVFLASVPVSLRGKMREIGIDTTGSVFLDHGHMGENYDAYSMVPNPPPSLLRLSKGGPPMTEINNGHYTQLPENLNPRVRELAEQITANAPSTYEKAATIEQYLRTRYTYSLQMATTPPADPITYFLFERKEGHCEYFASAMAVMLRSIGIATRIVNGFHGGEYNDLTGSYIIRGRDAHTWVEVYIPGYAWMSFDPTPADPRAFNGSWSRFLLYVDAAKEFWREWIINYDFFHQRELGNSAGSFARNWANRFRLWTRRNYVALLRKAWRVHRQVTSSPGRWGGGAIAVVSGILLLAALPWIVHQVKRTLLLRHPGRAPQSAASIWYGRMTHTVARRGYRKLPAQTPKEFVASIGDGQLRASVSDFTTHYERARFGDSAEDAEKLPEIYEVIEQR